MNPPVPIPGQLRNAQQETNQQQSSARRALQFAPFENSRVFLPGRNTLSVIDWAHKNILHITTKILVYVLKLEPQSGRLLHARCG